MEVCRGAQQVMSMPVQAPYRLRDEPSEVPCSPPLGCLYSYYNIYRIE